MISCLFTEVFHLELFKMFVSKLSLTITLIVLVNSYSVSSKECIYVESGDDIYVPKSNYVECKNVDSIQELISDITSDWHRLKIINDVDSILTTAG